MKKLKTFIKNYYVLMIIALVLILSVTIKLPYYIDTPGDINDIKDKISIDGYESMGSFNIVYVREYTATPFTMLISLFNKDWNIIKNTDILMDNEDDEAYNKRDKLFMQESISNSIYVAYTKADSDIKILSNNIFVAYISAEANTDLIVGDKILEINNIEIKSKEDISNIIELLDIGEKIEIKVSNSDKIYNRYSYIVEEDDRKVIGIVLTNVREYDTQPDIEISMDKKESGSSGGFVMALSIYNSLIKEDITHGLKIVGTGTIDLEGNVGAIGGVEYKLKSAVKNNADLFLVPKDNYDAVMKLKEKNNYDIEIFGVSTFDEALEYLESIK